MFYLATSRRSGPGRRGLAPFAAAVVSALLWNGAVLFFILQLWVGGAQVETTARQIAKYGVLLSWLASPAMGFYFAAQSES